MYTYVYTVNNISVYVYCAYVYIHIATQTCLYSIHHHSYMHMYIRRYVYIQAGLLYLQIAISRVACTLPNNLEHKVGILYQMQACDCFG